ncbi:MAG: hypothetical protein AAFR60_09590, partial [Pseudomonadota bacterium]
MTEAAKTTATPTPVSDAKAQSLIDLAKQPATIILMNESGRIQLRDGDGQLHDVPNSDTVTGQLGSSRADLADMLDQNRDLLADVVRIATATGDAAALASKTEQTTETTSETDGATGDAFDPESRYDELGEPLAGLGGRA